MARFVIKGGRPINGVFTPAGNKNAVLPMLAACLLTDEPVRLRNVPLIADVYAMLAMLGELGVCVRVSGHTVALDAGQARGRPLNPELCRQVRSSILFAGPMSARFGRCSIFPPGGDGIGRRRLDTHLLGLAALGIRSRRAGDRIRFEARKTRPASVLLDEASVTATENVMMAAALTPGRTIVSNAACEPHVRDLGEMLQKMGADIHGLGSNRLEITGAEALRGVAHTVCSDHVEIGSFVAAAAATGGSLKIRNAPFDIMAPVFRPFESLGMPLETTGRAGIRLARAASRHMRRDFGGAVARIESGPWPGFPSDLMSVAIVAATQAKGSAMFFEKMFESRMYFIDRLMEMGARVIQCDPHRVVVMGPSRLRAGRVSSPDIRAGMAMVIAALCARGVSVIENAQVIDRGYEALDSRLRELGADIERRD